MFYVVGQAGQEKPSSRGISCKAEPNFEDIIPLTLSGDFVLGKYGIDKHTEGTDTLPVQLLAPKIKAALKTPQGPE